MSVKVIIHQMEIGFWDVFISLMHKSSFLRFFAPRVYRLLHNRELYRTAALVCLMIVLGLTLGMLFGALSQI